MPETKSIPSITVISTGSELLRGAIVDANGPYICRRLSSLAVTIGMVMLVGDDIDRLERAIRTALDQGDTLLITGGLGPTDDDNTIAALSRIFPITARINNDARARMESFFSRMGASISEDDLKMVEVPDGSLVLPNTRGLAPGFIVRAGLKTVIALPGVPGEMREMMENEVMPFLREKLDLPERSSLTFRVTGTKESAINAAIKTMDIPLDHLEWGITAGGGIAAVTFTQNGEGRFEGDRITSNAKAAFGCRYLDPAYGSPEEEVVHLLFELSMTVSLAESCTGGLIAKRITDVPGSSAAFAGAVVAYDNGVKARLLGVREETLMSHGAVSEEAAAEMAAGARASMNTDIAVSTTGVAGPGGGSDAKPVGMVCFGLATAGGVKTFTRNFSGERERIRNFAALTALELLREHLSECAESAGMGR